MKTIRKFGFKVAAAAALAVVSPSIGMAQELEETTVDQVTDAEESWYRAPTTRTNMPSLAQEKAIQRASQRMARLEASRWYGFSGGRPTASGMPFTTMYSPAWQQPGGRPFAWYTSSRPIVIYANPTVIR